MNNIYDFTIIGAAISACTFASFLNKRFSDVSILLVEHGMRIGGRAITRKSRKYFIFIKFSKNICILTCFIYE